jgi:hypothetical protein
MIIYINGDSHTAGAEIIKTYCFAEDDPKYTVFGRRPHPDAIPRTYGYKLAQTLNCGFYLDAESGSSNDRILRTTRQFLKEKHKQDIFIIIGWSTWEREEWSYCNGYVQVTAGSLDSIPEKLQEKYKTWVSKQTQRTLNKKASEWHECIWDLHCELKSKSIKHLFFNSFMHFNNVVVSSKNKKDWNGCYIEPYDRNSTYYHWLKLQGYKTVRPGSYHYGEKAHTAWFKYLLPILTKKHKTVKIDTIKVKSVIQYTQ